MAGKVWTEEEIEYLKENYGIKSNWEIAEKLNRTDKSIPVKASKLGLVIVSKRKSWSKEDILYLQNNFNKKDINEIASFLNRTEATIKTRASLLGLTESLQRWSIEEIEYLKENYAYEDYGVLIKKLQKTKDSIQAKAGKLKLKKMTYERNVYFADLTNKRFGKLAVMQKTNKRYYDGNIVWECICDCGNVAHIASGNLVSGNSESCGCEKRKGQDFKNIKGKRYGRLIALERVDFNNLNIKSKWKCLCDCGTLTYITINSLNSGKTNSCGCLRKELLSANSGKKAWNYNPNKTNEERLKGRYILGKHNISNWRREVFKSNDYTCVVCHQIGGKLNAHHIDGWNWCKEKRFDIDNGVTLCVDCHKDFHGKYGRGDNTKEQFEEYKENKILVEVN